jgi:hypothetical protein
LTTSTPYLHIWWKDLSVISSLRVKYEKEEVPKKKEKRRWKLERESKKKVVGKLEDERGVRIFNFT